MTIKVTKPEINVIEKLNELKQDTGLKGQELMRADTVAEARTAIGTGRKNLLINGAMQVSQRGDYTSTPLSVGGAKTYAIDRWFTYSSISSEVLHGLVTLPNGITANTFKVTATATGTSWLHPAQYVEWEKHFRGREITVSGWVRTTMAGQKIRVCDGTDCVQPGDVIPNDGSWHYITGTHTLPTPATDPGHMQIHPAFGTDTVVVGDYIEFTHMQVEFGPIATDFEHRSYGEELALCQRYFQRISGGGDAFVVAAKGQGSATIDATIPLNVPLRASPTMNSINARAFYDNSSFVSSTGAPTANSYVDGNILLAIQHGGFSGLTNNKIYNWGPLSSAIEIDAEL